MLSGSDWLAYVRETQDSLRVLAEARQLGNRVAELGNRFRELERAQRLAAERLSPGHPELLKLQEDLARVSEEMARVNVALRESATAVALRPTPAGPFDSASVQLVAPSGRAAIRPGSSMALPTPIKRVLPQYTKEAMAAKVAGTVAVEVLVDERGHVADARVIRSIPLLDEAALQAARQWEFTETLLNGVPVPVLVMLELDFTLR
jgi:protein TonB